MGKKWILLFVGICLLFCSGMQAVMAKEMLGAKEELPQLLILKNFWFYEGYVEEEWWNAPAYVVPERAVRLFDIPDDSGKKVGELAAGRQVRLIGLVYRVAVSQYPLRTEWLLANEEGNVMLEPGTLVGVIANYGSDGRMVYAGGRILAVYAPDLPVPSWKRGRDGERQWLQVRDEERGLEGWCRFQGEPGEASVPLQERWRIQPHAAGGAANMNGIIFSDNPPVFQKMPILFDREVKDRE